MFNKARFDVMVLLIINIRIMSLVKMKREFMHVHIFICTIYNFNCALYDFICILYVSSFHHYNIYIFLFFYMNFIHSLTYVCFLVVVYHEYA